MAGGPPETEGHGLTRHYQKQTVPIRTPKPVRLDEVYAIQDFIDRDECTRLIAAWHAAPKPETCDQ